MFSPLPYLGHTWQDDPQAAPRVQQHACRVRLTGLGLRQYLEQERERWTSTKIYYGTSYILVLYSYLLLYS